MRRRSSIGARVTTCGKRWFIALWALTAPPFANIIPGDLNLDGAVSFADIPACVSACRNPAAWCAAHQQTQDELLRRADFTGDGVVTDVDIAGFSDRPDLLISFDIVAAPAERMLYVRALMNGVAVAGHAELLVTPVSPAERGMVLTGTASIPSATSVSAST